MVYVDKEKEEEEEEMKEGEGGGNPGVATSGSYVDIASAHGTPFLTALVSVCMTF